MMCGLSVSDVKSAKDISNIYRTRFQLEFVYRDGKQFMGLSHCQARNKEAISFAFNASLSSVNVARAYARKEGYNLSVGATKTLMHNAAMLDLVSRNLLVEEYPESAADIAKLSESRWLLRTNVCSLVGVARFYCGLASHIRIVDSPELKDFVKKYLGDALSAL